MSGGQSNISGWAFWLVRAIALIFLLQARLAWGASPTLTISSTSINLSQSATLTWSGGTSPCTASGAWSGSVATSGTSVQTPGTAGTYTYTLTCNNGANSVTLTVNQPTVTISVSPSSINLTQSATITWSTTNSNSCTASAPSGAGTWTGSKSTSGGSSSVTPTAAGTYTYTLTCNTVISTATLNVLQPTVTISASPSSISSGGTSNLTWSSANTNSCTASGSWTGTQSSSGTTTVTPSATAGTYTYTLTCNGVAASATVTVVPIVSVTVSPGTINSGSSATVSYTTTGATSCTASGAWTGSKSTGSGSATVKPTTAGSYTYTLTCNGVSSSATLVVDPVIAISVSPSTIMVGATATLTWSATGATSCTASGAWSGTQATSGSTTVNPAVAGIFIYTLTCDLGVSGSAALTVNAVAIPIFQSPLTVAIPAHPQVLLAVGNSESMDGNLAGAIMTGSGSLSSSLSLLNNSSSPTCFSTVSGFTPPLSAYGAGGCSSGTALYTSTSGSTLYDNSPSRLNVAKAGISAILNSYMPSADFALETYSTSSTSVYTTWQYQMSPAGSNFVFTSTQTAGNRYVTNPCYNYTTVQTSNPTIYSDCNAISTSGKVTGNVNTSQYMQVSPVNAGSSDDPLINDVLYAGGLDPICVTYGGPTPANPYTGTGSYTLSTYNSGGVSETYSSSTVSSCARQTTPTNAGYVPFTPETMYIQRGFGYGGSQSATTGNVIVPMKTAGQVPTSSTVASAIASFTSYLNPETNSTSTSEIKASAGQSALGGLMAGALSYYQNSNPASSNGCTPTRYVVLITDGLPTLDLNGKAWPPPGTVSATGWGMTVAFNSDGSLNTAGTNDQALLDTISKLQALNSAGIKVYVVGLGAGVDPTQNSSASAVLTAMAIAGGTGTANGTANSYNNNLPYGYFPATSPTALVSDLQTIIAQIIGATQSVATSAVNSTGLNTLTTVYRAQFSTQDSYQDWTGNISAFPVNATTGVVATTATWSAQPLLDASTPSSRIIATWQPATNSGIPFEWLASNSNSSATTGITPTSTLGVALTSTTMSPSSTDSDGGRRLNYLRGDTSYEQRNNPSAGKFRNRSHILGDIIDSSPLYVGAPSGYSTGTHQTFATTYANRIPVLYVGANDGMLHAFNANNGAELWAFIPNGVFSNLPMLTSPFYNAQHHFFVDGSPQAGDVQFSDGSWHTVLAGGENAGGNTIYALDVTNPASVVNETTLASNVLWEFSESDMGLSYSQPAFASTAAGYVVMFGNGYNSTFGKDILYVLNPQTGAQMAKIDLCAAVSGACNGAVTNGLSSITVVNRSGNQGGNADTVYAGDLQGNVWRVDISDPSPANWQSHVSVLLKAVDPSGARQPITTPPAVTLNPQFPQRLGTLVIAGTGQLLAVSDLSTTQTQTIYAAYDPGTITSGTVQSVNIRGGDMVGQTLTLDTSVTPSALEATSTQVNLATKKGWYDDLTIESRMRIVTAPRIEQGGGVVFTTYTPNSNQCTGGGDAYLLVLNYATGGAFPQPEFVWPGSSGLNQVNSQNPVGLALGNVFAASPTIITATGPGGANGLKLVTESSNSVLSIFDRGGNMRRTAWWEMQ